MTSGSSLQICLGALGTSHQVISEINKALRQSHTSCPIVNPIPTPRHLSWLYVLRSQDAQAEPVRSALGIIFHRRPHIHPPIVRKEPHEPHQMDPASALALFLLRRTPHLPVQHAT
ncbi:hypothetical protein BDW42DRAFT_156011 [Aspergillus taichungensis]|uniref:Uncharacterized protein n=1 Tax=Aspergillus taichungensis TaxID=482145 RepID=A0A2J5HKQ1_9EURO|nr:hypothetical protein BDW42DRAFT_156011 [Aspergillus taichungensis]